MDGQRFDALTRALAGRTSRRRALAVFLGAVGGGLVRSSASAAGQTAGALCNRNSQCASGVCGERDRAGRRRCQCVGAADCPAPANKCDRAVCQAGACTTGTPKVCAPCKTCSDGSCVPLATDPRCDGVCSDGDCVSVCLPVQSACDPNTQNCCQDDVTECSYEANCTSGQGDARCCRPIGATCASRCDCCENADCVANRCALQAGQQCASSSECALGGCCDGTCRNFESDVLNCGGCGRVCPTAPHLAKFYCEAGACFAQCGVTSMFCDGRCATIETDEENCGACDVRCETGERCCGGVCVTQSTDMNCGTCGFKCPSGLHCNNDICT